MKYNIYLLSYNNYYNRQVKKLDTIQDYINGGYLIGTIPNCNFAMRDGIASDLIVNQSFVETQPDYVLIAERGEGGVETGVFSRWFVIDTEEIRGNQYSFQVKRDIWVDYKDIAMNSSYFIERGYVQSSNDLIFNNEEQQYSQIKKSQTPLYDETGCPWIVGYIPKKLNKTSETTIETVVRPDSADYVVSDITQWPYYQYVVSNPNHEYVYSDNLENAFRFIIQLPIQNITGQGTSYQMGYFGYSLKEKSIYGADVHDMKLLYPNAFTEQETGFGYFTDTQSQWENDVSDKNWYNTNYSNLNSYIEILNRTILNNQVGRLSGTNYTNAIAQFRAAYNIDVNTFTFIENNLNGKTIKDTSTGKVYTITLNDRVIDKLSYPSGFDQTALKGYIRNMLNLNFGSSYSPTMYGYVVNTKNSNDDDQIKCVWKLKQIQINLSEVGNARTYLPRDDDTSTTPITVYRNHCIDQVYDMFAIPYGSLEVKDGANTYTCNKDVGLAIAQAFVTTLGEVNGQSVVYDLQMLPYCPVREYIQSDGTFDITVSDNTKVRPIYFSVNDQQNLLPINYVFYCSNSKIDNITLLHKVNDNWTPYNVEVTDTKLQYNTEMYRLSSPNFASSFEFNAAQNGGVNSFKVSATYKPYNPYIRIRPEFGRMYGEDFKDGRGLILQGDFSVATMSNAWINYELQNKNYLNSFNREIQSMNLQNKIANTQDVVNAITGSVQGAVGGAVAGAMVGSAAGPIGTVVGGVIGGVAGGVSSAVGGGIDVQNNRKLRNDTISKAKTLFNYQLDNIKALPNTIRNVGCLTVDNVLVPVLEFYQASDDEIDTFNKKMQFYGMSVMKVGSVIDYINPIGETFVQGYLLRLISPEGVTEEADNHLAEELSNELQKGLYFSVEVQPQIIEQLAP